MSEGIGERLREARTSRGLELEEAEQQIKIRKRFLVAMEDEDWDVLPGPAYVRSFLHTYAELLGLDADAVVDDRLARFPGTMPALELVRSDQTRPPARRPTSAPAAA